MALDDGWMKDAACRGYENYDAFFPRTKKGVKTSYKEAKAICAGCPVRTQCLFFAVAHKIPHGLWGGMTEGQRANMSRDLKKRISAVWFEQHPDSRPMSHASGYTGSEGR